MEDDLIKFYNKIYRLLLLNETYTSSEYIYPMDVAALILAQTDFKSGIIRREDDIVGKIDEKYNNSEIIIKENTVEYLQLIINTYGSNVVAKSTYNKIDFLSLLTSFKIFMNQINFIESLVDFYDGDCEVIVKIGGDILMNYKDMSVET